MPRIKLSKHGNSPFERLLGHNAEILGQWTGLEKAFFNEGVLSPKLKEQVRRVLAHGNKCEYCMAKGKPDSSVYDEQISLAAGFAEVFLNHKSSINDQTFNILRECFSDTEISELISFICFITASQTFGAVMDLK